MNTPSTTPSAPTPDPATRPSTPTPTTGTPLTHEHGRRRDLVVALLMPGLVIAFATYLVVGMVVMEVPEGTAFPGPKFFPGLIATALYALAAILVVKALRAWRVAGDVDPATAEAPEPAHMDWRSFAWIVGGILGFIVALPYLGWIIAAALLFWCVARGFGAAHPLNSLLVGFCMSSATYIAFDMALGLSLPSGILGGGF
ncbi:tripartite tricarboxylate transporter TctB family protein [Brevibacterium litoralis]|uniref:tripartite tricarboxylate transporter TctB family protein n=1 Tax=Brevibacterium litoralis TaxID=3138935 RepID=UPI0032EF50FE